MRTIFEIDTDIMSTFATLEFDEETGEILNSEKLDELQAEREAKIEAVALYVKELSAEAEALKAEEKRLKERRESKERQCEGMKGWLKMVLHGTKFETTKTAVTFRKSVRVVSDDETTAPAEYINVKTTQTVDKQKIKKALQDGIAVDGWELQTNQNISIK